MIVYNLKCEKGHHFEEWFTSSGRYDEMAGKHEIMCPKCSSRQVEKAPMAPSVSAGSAPSSCADAYGGEPACMSACTGGCMER